MSVFLAAARGRVPKRTLLLAYSGALLCLAAACVTAWTLGEMRAAARRQAEQAAGNLALSLERDVGRMVGALESALGQAARGARLPGIERMDPSVRQSILFDTSAAAQAGGGVFVFGSDGGISYGSVPTAPIDIADRDYFRQLRDDPAAGLVVSGPLRSRATGGWALAVARRVDDAGGGFAGVAVAGLELADLRALFTSFDVGERGVISLLTRDGRVLARRPYSEQDVGRALKNPALAGRLDREPSGSFEKVSDIDGVRRLYSYREIDGLPLVLNVGLALDEVYAPWRQKAAVIAGAVLCLLALGALLAATLRGELRRRGRAERAAVQAGRQQAAALARLRALFDSSADSMSVARVEPDGAVVYEEVNAVWERTTGVSAADARNRPPHAVLPPEAAGPVAESWRESVVGRRTVRAAFICPRGQALETVVAPVVDPDGRVRRLVAITRDMTERHEMEARLRDAHRMEAVGQLTAGVAHDFNNLLQTVLGGLEVLREEPGIGPEARGCAAAAEEAARRGAALTRRLLAFARKQPLTPSLLRPAEVLASAAALFARTLGGGVRVEVDADEAAGPIRVDRAQLDDCLLGLALNARDAMPQGGRLTLRARDAGPDDAPPPDLPPGRYVRFAVEDSGAGIGAELAARVFEPFFTTKRVGAGSGLGLSMVQGFARQSGGDVRIDAAPGGGARVCLWLPAAAPGPDAPAPARADGRRRRVLVADDEDGVRRMVSLFLERAGAEPVAAPTGEAALALLDAGEPFDLLVTDQSMPGMSGCDLIEAAARLRPSLPTMLITGYDKVSGLDRLDGRVTILRKPFERAAFIGQVEALIGPGAPALGGQVTHAAPSGAGASNVVALASAR